MAVVYLIGDYENNKEIGFLLGVINEKIMHEVEFCEPVHIYFESEDYSLNFFVHGDFQAPGFYWRAGDSMNGMPDAVAKPIRSSRCRHLIWLSKAVLDQGFVLASWTYLHQLAHLLQRAAIRDTALTREFLNELHQAEPIKDYVTQLEIPDELDAELFAKANIVEAFSTKVYEHFILADMLQPARYYERLAYLESRFLLFRSGVYRGRGYGDFDSGRSHSRFL